MQSRLRRLKIEARKAACFRGHWMGRYATHDRGNMAVARCLHCGRQVCVVARPMPNECEIMGEAVTVGCIVPTGMPSARKDRD